MNRFYDVALARLLSGQLDLVNEPLAVSAWAWTWYYAEDVNVSTLSGSLAAAAVDLQNVEVNGRTLEAEPVTFPAVVEGMSVNALVLHRRDDGLLIAFIDQRPDLAPLSIWGNGGPITFNWGGADARTVISL